LHISELNPSFKTSTLNRIKKKHFQLFASQRNYSNTTLATFLSSLVETTIQKQFTFHALLLWQSSVGAHSKSRLRTNLD
jgi:hypothetical protein